MKIKRCPICHNKLITNKSREVMFCKCRNFEYDYYEGMLKFKIGRLRFWLDDVAYKERGLWLLFEAIKNELK